jgi:glycosyltransferase involved in cell wall biosynthesis
LIFYSILKKLLLKYFLKNTNRKIIFGTTPILNNKYWAEALREIGYETETLMETYYSAINKKEDFDKYFDDVIPKIFRKKYINRITHLFFVWFYIINNAKIFVMPFSGVVFRLFFWKIEYLLFKINNIKTILIPYGADAYMYSRIRNKSLQNALLIDYPMHAREEKLIEKKVFFWSKYADFIMTGFMGIDGMPRWDVTTPQCIVINADLWKSKTDYNENDGYNGVVKIIHAPNHRGFKGTEFLIKVVDELKQEGLKVELILCEKIPNNRVRELMLECDILVEQLIFLGYALTAIEGMACGLPVLSNLDNEEYTRMFRLYSFLNECPILSTTPETLKDNLKLLITNPELRKELGILGRRYVEKYHSYKTAQYLFTNIFKKLEGETVDTMNLFHPMKSEYVKNNYIKTPLLNNKYIPVIKRKL